MAHKITYNYQPEVCQFWIGAKLGPRHDGKEFHHKFVLQSWMDVNDVIDLLEQSKKIVSEKYLHTH